MPIYKNKDNDSWYIKTYVKDKNGVSKQITKRNKKWTGRNGKILAQQEENRLINSIDEIPYENKIITINELCDNYLNSLDVRDGTYNRYNNIIKTYIKPFLGEKQVRSIKNIDISNWHKKLDKCKARNKDEFITTIYKQKIHSTLSTIFNYGCIFYNIEKNIPKIVGNFKLPKGTNKKKMSIMTLDEFNNFISLETNEQYRLFFTLLFFTGMRRGELLCLMWEDINFKERTISITKTMDIRKGAKIEKPKTDKSNRKIKMIDKVYNELFKIRKDHGYIFELYSIKGTTLDRKCKNNCKRSGFTKNMRIHDFRHSFASLCINNNVPIAIISEYLGHENISTTLDIYSHLYPDSQNKLVEILNYI